METISRDHTLKLLEKAYQETERLKLPRDHRVDGRPKDRGALVMRAKYRLDSYTTYKTPAGDAVSLGIIQGPDGDPFVSVHRRQSRGGRLLTIASDQFRLEDLEDATEFFLATAVMISRHPHSWHERHPSDSYPVEP